jgi:hypothetical protein
LAELRTTEIQEQDMTKSLHIGSKEESLSSTSGYSSASAEQEELSTKSGSNSLSASPSSNAECMRRLKRETTAKKQTGQEVGEMASYSNSPPRETVAAEAHQDSHAFSVPALNTGGTAMPATLNSVRTQNISYVNYNVNFINSTVTQDRQGLPTAAIQGNDEHVFKCK